MASRQPSHAFRKDTSGLIQTGERVTQLQARCEKNPSDENIKHCTTAVQHQHHVVHKCSSCIWNDGLMAIPWLVINKIRKEQTHGEIGWTKSASGVELSSNVLHIALFFGGFVAIQKNCPYLIEIGLCLFVQKIRLPLAYGAFRPLQQLFHAVQKCSESSSPVPIVPVLPVLPSCILVPFFSWTWPQPKILQQLLRQMVEISIGAHLHSSQSLPRTLMDVKIPVPGCS